MIKSVEKLSEQLKEVDDLKLYKKAIACLINSKGDYKTLKRLLAIRQIIIRVNGVSDIETISKADDKGIKVETTNIDLNL